MKKQYQTPHAQFESLRLRENVADACWGYDIHGYTGNLFFDRVHKSGYTKFRITTSAGTCRRDGGIREITVIHSEGDDAVSEDWLESRGPLFVGISKCSGS